MIGTKTVATDSGYRMQFELADEGPLPLGYYVQHELWIASDRVPKDEKDELEGLAWDAWRHRHEDFYDEDDE